MKIRKLYDARPDFKGVDFSKDPGRTKASEAAGCDIHQIMRRFQDTGQLPGLIKQNPEYGDFSDPMDFQEALNRVNHATAQFAALSSRVRERFGNDPKNFLEFCSNPENKEEMVKLGLTKKIEPPAPVAPQEVVVVDDKRKKTPAGKPDGGQA